MRPYPGHIPISLLLQSTPPAGVTPGDTEEQKRAYS